MPDLQQQLQAILGDREAMGQIAALAQALSGGQASPAPAAEPAREEEYLPVEAPAVTAGEPTAEAAPLPDLSALMGALGDVDPKLIQFALGLFSEYSAKDDEKAALLAALKPFLKAERLEKMEKAEKIARLSRVVRSAIAMLKEGEGHV